MLTRLRRLWRDRRGNAMIIAGAGLPMLIAAAGLGVDTFALSVLKRQMQRAADSGALAAAYAKAQNQDITIAVDKDVDINAIEDRLNTTPVVESAPTAGSFAGDDQAVRVKLSANGTAPFINFFLRRTIALNVEATARVEDSGEYCIVSLYDGDDEAGIDISGDANLNLGCGMKTNAQGDSAFIVTGNSEINADPLAAAGTVPASDNIPAGTTVLNNQTPQPDPFEDIPDPPDCTTIIEYDDETTLNPTPDGTCLENFDVDGPLTLASGTYYLTGDVSFGVAAEITGTDVVLVMTGTGGEAGDLSINAQASVNLTAPTTGTYDGVALYRDRRTDPSNQYITFNGGADFSVQGAIYMPTTRIRMNGNFGAEAQCLNFVAYIVDVNGGGDIDNECPAGSYDPITGIVIRLVA